MKKTVDQLSFTFAAGAFGALVSSFALWFLGAYGFTAWLGVRMAPAWTAAWLYPRIVRGGIWGFLFLLPFARSKTLFRAFIFSLAPSLFQLLVVFPNAGRGIAGLELGLLTPFFVVVINAVWGFAAAFWLRAAGR